MVQDKNPILYKKELKKRLFDGNLAYRLLLDGVEKGIRIFYFSKINPVQVDAADGTVVHRTEIDLAVLHVRSRSPLGRTGDICRHLALGKLNPYRNVEVVQNLGVT